LGRVKKGTPKSGKKNFKKGGVKSWNVGTVKANWGGEGKKNFGKIWVIKFGDRDTRKAVLKSKTIKKGGIGWDELKGKLWKECRDKVGNGQQRVFSEVRAGLHLNKEGKGCGVGGGKSIGIVDSGVEMRPVGLRR